MSCDQHASPNSAPIIFLTKYSKHQAGIEKKRPRSRQLCVKTFVQGTWNFIPDTTHFPNSPGEDETQRNVSTHEIRKLEEICNIKALLLSQDTAITGSTVPKYS